MREISKIAQDIRDNWPVVHYTAEPYLDAMSYLTTMQSYYILDSASTILVYFLSNASQFKGENARRIKKELNEMLANNR